MPDFPLSSVPGLEGTLAIAENATGVAAPIGLRDGVLFLPRGRRLPLTASHARGSGGTHVLTLTGTFVPAVPLLAGQLSLESLSLTLRFRASGSGMVLDTAAADAVVASGIVRWIGATELGFGSTPVDLRLSYRFNGGIGGFALELAHVPLPVPGALAQIQSAEVRADFPTDRPVLVVTLKGQAGLTSAGQAGVNQLLRQLFPAAPTLRPVGFVIRQEFALVNGAVPSSAPPASTPFFRVDFDWPVGSLPALANLPAHLAVDVGKPSFSFPLGGGSTPAGWALRLPETGIRFPGIPSLAPFQLRGTLHVESGTATRVSFAPSAGGGLSVPEIGLLLSRLGWGGSRVSLDEVAQAASFSGSEREWQGVFAGLLPVPIPAGGLDLPALSLQLDDLLASAIASSGLPTDRIFFNAMQGLVAGGHPACDLLWQKWFAPSGVPDPFGELPNFLMAMAGVPKTAFDVVIGSLLDRLAAIGTSASFGTFFTGLLKDWAAGIELGFDGFLQATAQMLRVALGHLPQVKLDLLAGGLIDALVRVPELQPIRAFPGLPPMPIGDGLLASSIGRLSSDGPGGRPSSAGLFSGMVAAAGKRGSHAERRRAKDALVNAAATPDAQEAFLLGAVWDAAVRHIMPWWDLIDRPVNAQTRPGQVLTLPAGKYLIVSDVHRDRESDRGAPLEFNSISHFRENRDLFLQVILWAEKSGYTIVEGGDCEELWFVKDKADSDRAKMLREIIESNAAVYDALRRMHKAGRYFRIYGNHDSQLRDPDIHAILKTEMEKGGAGAFTIYDFVVIDGVKTMVEHTALDKALEFGAGLLHGTAPEAILRDLAKGTVGMDANDYTATCRMLVTHGHQWDFYNCDPNNVIGMFIANQVGVRVDKTMDPILEARGIAIGGNPWIDFGDVLSRTPVANCWPSESDAMRLAHQVQHMANADRKLVDSVMYKESLTAITGTFGIALNAPGTEETPERGRERVDVRNPRTVLTYLKNHHNHHICIGHTHNPHSQPHFALKNIATGIPGFGNLVPLLPDLVPVNPNLFKSKYFNSGTSGWWEGVIWAIQIDETHQARLVYWTSHSGMNPATIDDPTKVKLMDPETMDWELTGWRSDVRDRFPRTKEDLIELLEDFFQHVVDPNQRMTLTTPEEWAAMLQAVLIHPIELFQAAIATGSTLIDQAASILDDVVGGTAETLDAFRDAAEQLQTDLLKVLLTLRSRAAKIRRAGPEVFVLGLPIDDVVFKRLMELRERAPIQRDDDDADARALHAAVVVYPLLENYPRNIFLAGLASPRFQPERSVLDSATPMLTLFASVVSLFPPAGRLAQVGDQVITSELEITGDGVTMLMLTITIRDKEAGDDAAIFRNA